MLASLSGDHDDLSVGWIGIEALDELGALRQHGALIEITLVGDFTGIDAWWVCLLYTSDAADE